MGGIFVIIAVICSLILIKVYDEFISYGVAAFSWIAFFVYVMTQFTMSAFTAVLMFFCVGMIVALLLGAVKSYHNEGTKK